MNRPARLAGWAEADAEDLPAGLPLVVLADVRDRTFPAALFTPAELDRAGRFRFAVNRAEYLGARAIIRLFLARHVGLEPAAIRLEAPRDEKPGLVDPECAGIDVSLSHSGGHVACAFLRAGAIGVDLEARARRRGDLMVTARRVLSPGELEALRGVPAADARRLFLRAWTRKEAVLKAAGLGLSVPTSSFEVLRGGAGAVEDVSPVRVAGRTWTCESHAPPADVELAVAYALDRAGPQVR